MTDAEIKLWTRLKGKQILGIQFYRQRPIGNYVVDFLAPMANLVVELDGSQHFIGPGLEKDKVRDEFLMARGLQVLRFNNLQVLKEIDGVLSVIGRTIELQLKKNPPTPFF